MPRSYEEVWEGFCRAGKTTALTLPGAGGSEAADRAGEPRLHLVYLIALGGNREVVAAARAVQERLCFPDLAPVAAARLHVSVQGLDVPVRTWQEKARELRVASRQALDRVAPFALRIGSANSFDVATILEVYDGGKIGDLRAALRAGLPAWTGIAQDPFVRDGEDAWIPHMSIAYYQASRPNGPLVEVLSDLRATAGVTVAVDAVQLVSMSLAGGPADWNWTVEATFPL